MSHPNILQIQIEEPTSNPAQPSKHHALADDIAEAEKRYRALIRMLISQLTGLTNTHVRFIVSPAEPEAIDAVSFWLLPLFRGKVTKHPHHFLFTPEQNAPDFTIEFTIEKYPSTSKYKKLATLSAHCPQCSARWINAAMMRCSEAHQVTGLNYLTITHQESIPNPKEILLPPLPLIHNASEWDQAIHSPAGPKLMKFYHEL